MSTTPTDIDDILNSTEDVDTRVDHSKGDTQEPAAAEADGKDEAQAKAEADAKAQQAPEDQAPPADSEDDPNTVAGLKKALAEARRKAGERNDWKGQAERNAGELAALRQQMQAQQDMVRQMQQVYAQRPQQPAEPEDNATVLANYIQQKIAAGNTQSAQALRAEFDERLQQQRIAESNTRAIREYGADKVQAAFQEVNAALANHPYGEVISKQILSAADPYAELMRTHKLFQVQAATNGDLEAYEARIREEARKQAIEEYLRDHPKSATPAQAIPPRSLASARSASNSQALSDGIPTDIDAILRGRSG